MTLNLAEVLKSPRKHDFKIIFLFTLFKQFEQKDPAKQRVQITDSKLTFISIYKMTFLRHLYFYVLVVFYQLPPYQRGS